MGLDYLSTLAYRPSVAFAAAGRLAPLVTVLVAAVTLFLALPVYCYIAGRSPHGGGSTARLERVVPGWFGKLLVLVLLAFGSVDLVFTRTFSAADAAEHLVHSPHPDWQHPLDAATRGGEKARQALPPAVQANTGELWNRQTVVTLIVLALSTVAGLVFFKAIRPGSCGWRWWWSWSTWRSRSPSSAAGRYTSAGTRICWGTGGRTCGPGTGSRAASRGRSRTGPPARRVRAAVPVPGARAERV
jgi:hypothetical protein